MVLGRTVVLYRTTACKRLITVDKVWRGIKSKSLILGRLVRALKARTLGSSPEILPLLKDRLPADNVSVGASEVLEIGVARRLGAKLVPGKALVSTQRGQSLSV